MQINAHIVLVVLNHLGMVMECDCGNIFCEHCSAKDEEDDNDSESEIIILICPKCGSSAMFI